MVRKSNFRRIIPIAALFMLCFSLTLITHPLTIGHSSLAYSQDVANSNIYYLPHLNLGQGWQTTINITNTECKGEHRRVTVTLTAYDKDGVSLGVITGVKRLRANKTKTINTQILPPGTESLKIESNGNLICNAIFKTTDGKKSEVVPAIKEPSKQLDFPSLVNYDDIYIYETITLLNPNTTPASIDIIALDKEGYEIDRNALPSLSSMENKTFSLVEIFDPRTLKDLSMVRVNSESNIIGLQLVDYPGVDLVGLPALTTTSKGWTFPIATKGENFNLWTKVGILNPGNDIASVAVEAFDASNNSLGIIQSQTILPGVTYVINTANIDTIEGDAIPLNAATLKVTSNQPVIGYEVIGILDGNGLTAAMGIPDEDKTIGGFEITGTDKGGVLNAYSMVRMEDRGVKSTVLNLGSKKWGKSIKIIDIEPEGTHILTRSKESKSSDVVQTTATCNQSSKSKRPFPVIFVHGLMGSAESWAELSKFLTDNGWCFGGSPTYDRNTKQVIGVDKSGDFYTLNFSSNVDLHLDQQGYELAAIIQAVLDKNAGKTKVILISHSMGGLAAREYLQGLARYDENKTSPRINYRSDVAQLITIGTPHQGSESAEIAACFKKVIPIAVIDLEPNSEALGMLNNLKDNSLPPDILYASIIGIGVKTIPNCTTEYGDGIVTTDYQNYITNEIFCVYVDGDGIVTTDSQDLANLSGTSGLMHQSIPIFIICTTEEGNGIIPKDHQNLINMVGTSGLNPQAIPISNQGQRCCVPLGCTASLIFETHTCETSDKGVWAELLKQTRLVPTVTVASPNGGESWQNGTTQTIRWAYTGNPGSYLKIELLKGGSITPITSSAFIGSNGSGSYNWTIPSTQTTGSDYKVRVTSTTNSSFTDTSDNNFTIGGTSLTVTYFRINSNASSINSRIVTLNNTTTDSPTHYMASESFTFSGTSWQSYSTVPSFTLSSGNGTKTVYFKIKNSAGVESVVVNDSITLNENPPPVINSVSPNPVIGSDNLQTITLYGNNFAPGLTVAVGWTGSSKVLDSSRVFVDSSSQVRISITTGTKQDTWWVKVTNPDRQSSNTANFQVISPINPQVECVTNGSFSSGTNLHNSRTPPGYAAGGVDTVERQKTMRMVPCTNQ